MNKERKAQVLAKFYLRYGRGNGLINPLLDVFQFGTLGILLIDKMNEVLFLRYFNFSIPIYIVAICIPVFILTLYFLGLYDEKLGFWKFQNSYNAKELTPFWDEMSQKLERIDKKINGKQKEF